MRPLVLITLLFSVSVAFCRAEEITPEKGPVPNAAKLVGQMRGISMQPGAGLRSDGKPDPKEELRQKIMAGFRAIGPECLPALVEALGDPEVQMRRNAALALVFLANPYEPKPRVDTRAAIPALIKATKDADSDVRAWAAHALAEIGPDAAPAVPDLILLLEDPTEGPKNTSCMALASIGPAAQTALPALKKALDDPSADVRQFAKAAIGKITAPSTTPKL